MVLDGFAAYFDAYLENIVREGKSEHIFQCRLNGRYAARLFLPAVKAAAVVG